MLNSTGLPLPRLSMRAASKCKAQHQPGSDLCCSCVAKLTSQPTLLMTTGLPLSSDSMWASSSACASISSARRYRICGCLRGGNRGVALGGQASLRETGGGRLGGATWCVLLREVCLAGLHALGSQTATCRQAGWHC